MFTETQISENYIDTIFVYRHLNFEVQILYLWGYEIVTISNYILQNI